MALKEVDSEGRGGEDVVNETAVRCVNDKNYSNDRREAVQCH